MVASSMKAYLFCQSVRNHHVIIVARFVPQQIRDISWSRRSWLVFKTSEVCLHFILVDFNLNLVGKLNVN